MTKQERIDQERHFEQKEREIASNERVAAALERLSVVQEVNVKLQAGGATLLDAALAPTLAPTVAVPA